MGIFMGNDFIDGRYTTIDKLKCSEWLDVPDDRFISLIYLRSFIANRRQYLRRRPHHPANFWEAYFREPISREFFVKHLGLRDQDFGLLSKDVDPGLLSDSFGGLINPSYLMESMRNRVNKSGDSFYNEMDFRSVTCAVEEAWRLLSAKGIRFLVLVIPDINEVYPESFRETCRRWGLNDVPARVKQLPEFRNRLIRFCETNGIDSVDLAAFLRAGPGMPYYPIDGHLNSLGHSIMADVIFAKVKEMQSALNQPVCTQGDKKK